MNCVYRIGQQHRRGAAIAGFAAAGAILAMVAVGGSPISSADPTGNSDLDITTVDEFDQAISNVTQASDLLKDAPTISASAPLFSLEETIATDLLSDLSGTEEQVDHQSLSVQGSPLILGPPDLVAQTSQQYLDAVEGLVAADNAGETFGLVEHIPPLLGTEEAILIENEVVSIAVIVVDFITNPSL